MERHSVSSDQHLEKLMSLREGLHVMMQCYMRQHFADRYWLHEHPGGHASRRELTMRKFTKESTTHFVKGLVCRWNVQKMRSESSVHKQFENQNCRGELLWKSMHRKFWERSWMNPQMQTTLLNTYPPKLSAAILKALREHLKESDQLHSVEETAGPVPEILLVLCWLRDVKRSKSAEMRA